ncbi:muscle-specific protein 300 kDa isoform X8 [Malaya genurostris]|uniref:muscle-specific protein 300 kDa isoform X8 n=1 Tax=Malaya genurostris TaxID=325434 RepID=UPI0026F3FC07|nr:muscle-specific protein 300 kDa isoform X8 [Malaya genurostris]
MSGPKNNNNNVPVGSGRGWQRTPPPTYFRSPSPWIPPGSVPVTQHDVRNQSNIRIPVGSKPESVIFNETRYQKSSAVSSDGRSTQEMGLHSIARDTHAVPMLEHHINTQLPTTPHSHCGYSFQSAMSPITHNATLPVEQMNSVNPSYLNQHGNYSAKETGLPQIPSYVSNPSQYIIYDQTGETGPSTAEIIANQSQDYIDEKLAEYQATIHLLQDEQERVQKKTFVNWINSFLCKRNPPLKIQDLIHDLKDGTKLLALLEVLSGERLPMEKGKILRRPHYLSNINTALQFLINKRIKLVNINPSDIVDGRPAVVLGLIWTIILYFQIEENSRILQYLDENLGGSVSSLDSYSASHTPQATKATQEVNLKRDQDMMKQGPRKTLLSWVNNALPKQSGLEVHDFGASWRDGFAFLSLIDSIKTNLINIVEMKQYNNRHRLDTAFNVAESELGIARLLDAEDVDVNSPDEKSIMTYVAQFLHKYPDVKNINSKSENELELLDLITWLQNAVRYYDGLNGNYPNSYDAFVQFEQKKSEKWNVFKKIKTIYASRSTPELQKLNIFWPLLERHMQLWLWYLDNNLPDQFGVIGIWLSNGEKLMVDDDIPSIMNEETASLISKKLEAHKQFFVAYYDVLATFNELKSKHTANKNLENHIKSLERRLTDIEPKAKQRRVKLKFLEHKCCLIAFLNLLENKINGVKYNNEEIVRQSLDQLKNFVTRNHIMQEFEKALIDMRQVIEEYKIDGKISKKEVYDIDTFLRDIEERWKNISARLICTETMLEDVINNWQRWKSLANEMEKWIFEAELALKLSEDEKIYFFQNLSKFKEKCDVLTDTYNILKSTCDYEASVIMDNRYKQIMLHWEQVFQSSKQYLHVGDVLQHRHKFKTDATQLSEWIQNAEQILASNNLKNSSEIKKCETDVKHIACEIESMEELFKSISRSFQVLIKEYSRDEVDRMMNLMKKEKEALVCIRAQIPTKLHLFHQILTQKEALESGQKEITGWLDESENLLISYAFNNDPEQTTNNLSKHKMFFSRTLYYKSMLESKNNVFQNLLKLSNTDNSVDMTDTAASMKQLNERFAYVMNNANEWEYKLQENMKIWENFSQSRNKVENYLRQAGVWQVEPVPLDKVIDVESQIEFFSNTDPSIIGELELYTEELLKFLPPNEQRLLISKVQSIQKEWSDTFSRIPNILLKLQFKSNEIKFYNYVYKIEKELNAEEQAFNYNENFENIIQRNVDFFKTNDLQEVENTLATLERTNCVYLEKFPLDPALSNLYQKANDRWVVLCRRIEAVKNSLYKIPAQWEAYYAKFNEMSDWMDCVDQSLKKIIVEKDSMEQFEQEKIAFQLKTFMNICFEADSKRDDMKWLVKSLDYLLNHISDDKATIEQEKIENLIARYKTLIPIIETTMTKTETFAKCYTYRHETQEVCDLLNRIKMQSVNSPSPDSYKKVNVLIDEQNFSIRELDNQRAHIMKMIQKGKDLSKNVNAPDFMNQEVIHLEHSWNETYNEAADRLKSLKDIHKIWTSYNEQKGKIAALLNDAELELRSITPLQTDPKSVTQDLEMKKQLILNLRQASSVSLLSLNDLCRELGQSIPPNSKQAIEKEVVDIEKRVLSTADFVDKRIDYLEDYNNKWKEYKERLDSLKNWANNVYPKMVAAIKQPNLTPEERVVKTMQLENVLTEKMKTLDILNASATDLASKEGNLEEMKRLKSEVTLLQGMFVGLNNAVHSEKAIVKNDLSAWKDFNDDLIGVISWTEKTVATGEFQQIKVGSLPEAMELQSKLDKHTENCQQKISELQDTINKCNSIKYGMKPTEEIDKCYVNLTDLYENAQHLKGKVGKLVSNWTGLDTDLKKQENFLNKVNERLRPFLEGSSGELPIDKLEEKINGLKLLNNEIAEQQTKLISAMNLFDQISTNITDDGASTLRDRLNHPRDQLSKMSENVRILINECYQNIVVQQNFNALMGDFSDWMDQMRTSISGLEETSVNDIDLTLQNVLYLLQQHANKNDMFNNIYAHVKQQSLNGSEKNNALLDETYSSLASNYHNLESTLQTSRNYLQKWAEFLHWDKSMKDQIRFLKDNVTQNDNASEADLNSFNENVSKLNDSIDNWKKAMVSLEHQPCIKLYDTLKKPVNAVVMIVDLENKLDSIKTLIGVKQKEIDHTKERIIRFEKLQNEVISTLNEISDSLKDIVKQARLSNIDECLEKLSDLNNQLDSAYAVKSQAQCEGNILSKQDMSSAINIRESLAILDKELCNIRQETEEVSNIFASVRDSYNDFNRGNMGFHNDLKNINAINKATVLTFHEKQSLVRSLEQLKNASDTMKNIKKTVDIVANKANEVTKNFRGYNLQDCENLLDIVKDNNEKLKNNLQMLIDNSNLLDQRLSLYKQIEDQYRDIEIWLDMVQDQFNRVLDNPKEMEHKIRSYKSELPTQLSMKENFKGLLNEFKRSNGNVLPNDIAAMKTKLDKAFAKVEQDAIEFNDKVSEYTAQERSLKDQIRIMIENLYTIREEIMKCDDNTLEIVKQLNNLDHIKKVRPKLNLLGVKMTELKNNIVECEPIKESTMSKEIQNLEQRYGNTVNSLNETENKLSKLAEKLFRDKLMSYSRVISSQSDKMQWCHPESSSDKHNLEMKKGTLNDIKIFLDSNQSITEEVSQLLSSFPDIFNPAKLESLMDCKCDVEREFQQLRVAFNQLETDLNFNIELWQKYEQISGEIIMWLKEVEQKHKMETILLVDVFTLNEKIDEIKSTYAILKEFDPKLSLLHEVGTEINTLNPDSRVLILVQHLQTRYKSFDKYFSNMLERLLDVHTRNNKFKEEANKLHNWIQEVENEQNLENNSLDINYDKIKARRSVVIEQENTVTDVCSIGENLYAEVNVESRDRIKEDIQSLRNAFTSLVDVCNVKVKQVETNIMNKKSIEESFGQLFRWLSDLQNKLSDLPTMCATLQEKKSALLNYMTMLKDLKTYEINLEQLQVKLAVMPCTGKESRSEEAQKEITTVKEDLSKIIQVMEDSIKEHIHYDNLLDKSRTWLQRLQSQTSELSANCEMNRSRIEEILMIIENVLLEEDSAFDGINDCYNQYTKVVVQTHEDGHTLLLKSFESNKQEWKTFYEGCKSNKETLLRMLNQLDTTMTNFDGCIHKMNAIKNQIKEITTKPIDNKEQCSSELHEIKNEIESLGILVRNTIDQSQAIRANINISNKIIQTQNEYRALMNQFIDAINRTESAINEHSSFNKCYDDFVGKITKNVELLNEHNKLVGDLSVLQDKQMHLKEIAYQRLDQMSILEEIISKGEKLCSQSLPDGRENIRQRLTELRKLWDHFSDELELVTQKVDQCILQFGEFRSQQEQLSKWLKDIEMSMKSNSELKSNIQEKHTQHQNHKMLHQDILSQSGLIDSVCSKAQQLLIMIKDEHLQAYLISIKDTFKNIVEKSNNLLDNLNSCVNAHNNYITSHTNLKHWINEVRTRAMISDDSVGEKNEIKKRLESLNNLQSDQSKGNELLNHLLQCYEIIKLSTTLHGISTADNEIQFIKNDLKNLDAMIEEQIDNQKKYLSNWTQFDTEMDTLTKWCRSMEAIFRDQQLFDTLEKKRNQLQLYRTNLELIIGKQKDIDDFATNGQTLFNKTGVEKIKFYINQLINRYQLLLVLSKEVVNRTQSIVNEHANYEERLVECKTFITNMSIEIEQAANEKVSTINLVFLQKIEIEKEKLENIIANIISTNETILTETSPQGREKLRDDVKEIKELWSNLQLSIANLKKQQDVRSIQWASYCDILQQLLTWLTTMEQKIDMNESQSWSTTQEIRSKLFKYKSLLQEIMSQRRMVDSLNEKAVLISDNHDKDPITKMESINERFELLKTAANDMISKLEQSLAFYNRFHEMQKNHIDEQEMLLTDLKQQLEISGSKRTVLDKIQKVTDIQNVIPETKERFDNFNKLIFDNKDLITCAAMDNIENELKKMQSEFEKFIVLVDNTKIELQKRVDLWDQFQIDMDEINCALSGIEGTMHGYALKNTLAEKQQQHDHYQTVVGQMKQLNLSFENLLDKSTELLQNSGDTKIHMNMQQMKSRMQSVETAVKEIAKKCEQAFEEHKHFKVKYDDSNRELDQVKGTFDSCKCDYSTNIMNVMQTVKELLEKHNAISVQCSYVSDVGEMLYTSTAVQGQQLIRVDTQDLMLKFERIFDEINSFFKTCETRLSKLSSIKEKLEHTEKWLANLSPSLLSGLILKPTLDEKILQHQAYVDLANELKNYKPEVNNLNDFKENLEEPDTQIELQMKTIIETYNIYLDKSQHYVNSYEKIVINHRQYCKAVLETSDFIDANHNTIELWGETDLDQVSLLTNLDRLVNLKKSILAETNRIEQIRDLGQLTMPDTSNDGQANIRTQIDLSQQEWEGLLVEIDSTIEHIQCKIAEWIDFENMRKDCMDWMRSIDTNIHSIDLKATLEEKKATLDYLKSLQGEVKAKEIEIDNYTEKGQQLYRGYLSCRSTQISELAIKYQQTASRIKELVTRWQQYVICHQELISQISEHKKWLSGIKEKINYCSDQSTTSEKELQSKLKVIQELIVNKEEGTSKMQIIIDLSQQVLACTTPSGHDSINRSIALLQDEWSALTLRMIDIKSQLDEALSQWSGFLDQVKDLRKKIDWMEIEFKSLSEFQCNMAEKRAQLDKIKNTEEKVRLERIEIEPLKQKATEMDASGQQTQAYSTAKQILAKFDYVADQLNKLLTDREDQYRDHRLYKEAYEDLQNWINRAREKLPCIKQQSLSDKLTTDNAIAPLDSLMNKKAQGELLVEHLVHTGEVVMASTSTKGKEMIRKDISDLKYNFEDLFHDIYNQKRNYEKTLDSLRAYKDEYERLSEWLQQIDILVKNHKLALSSNLQDKEKQVNDMQSIITKLDDGHTELDKFNAFSAPLLQSHLDSYISNQLRHINSRYQVQVNIAKDVLKKVQLNYELHKEYIDNLCKANSWIENAKEVVRCTTENTESVSKENLEKRLSKIIELIQQREQGQRLVNNTVNTGEKVMKTTKSDGKEVINNEIKDIQNAWDRLVKKMSTAKVHLETSLLQWADYSSSYNHLQQWIQDRETKLQRVSEQKTVRFKAGTPTSLSTGLNERKANLRQANDIVQDIVSFEPMIQSVASKASDLRQISPASEISKKYENLSTQAKELFAKQKETIELHQAFIDCSNEFAAWIRNAKENLNKCSDPRGDKDSLVSKMTQIKILDKDVLIGQTKLEKALEQAEIACRNVETEECEAIEKEVAILQDEFDNYCLALKKIGASLENGIVRWKEYDDQYTVAVNWLDKLEQEVQTYNKMQNTLEEKKNLLEEFQEKLQTLFDWQKELDNLNVKAQILLEICADTRVSNGVTQLTTKYNVLLSIAKETMRRLELHYQEHQQHNTLYGECQDWLDRLREKLNECDLTPHTVQETQSKLNIIKGIRQSLEQGQNKLRYLFELKEKIMIGTESTGASKIAEDTENLKMEYESLMIDINEIRQRLLAHLAQLEDITKLGKMLAEWIEEVQAKLVEETNLNELSDKRMVLEKLRAIYRETANYNDITDKIKSKLSENSNIIPDDLNIMINEYNNLVAKIVTEIERLENQVNNYEKFRQGLHELYDWMKHTRQSIEKLSDYHGDRERIVEKLSKIQDIHMSLSEGKILLENVNELGNKTILVTGQEGLDSIKQDLVQAKSDWNEIEVLSDLVHKTITDVLASWESFYEKSNNLSAFICEYETKISALDNSSNGKQENTLKSLKNISDIIMTKKPTVDELNDVCEILMEKSACPTVRDRTVDLQKSYSSLLSNLQGIISKLEKNVSSHTEFTYYKDELNKWIDEAKRIISESQDAASDDINDTKRKISTIQTLSNTVPQGQKFFEMLQDSFTKSSYLHSEEQQTGMFQNISELRDILDSIIINISTSLNNLNIKHNRLELYEELKIRIADWLNTTESGLETIPQTRGEISEVKTILERVKHIHTEITFKQADIDRLQHEAMNLFDSNRSSIEKDSASNYMQRNLKLDEKCGYIIKNLEAELAEQMAYYQGLQEIEKWLLQISFQLMAHNSLYIHNREQTLEQIAQHEKLLGEIQHYQVNLDDINAKGQNQIDRYFLKAPEIKSRIENQMKNIRDSYLSLLNTSVQIKNRLHDSLNKFQEYEDTLDDINNNLNNLEPEIQKMKLTEISNHIDGKVILENAQEYHNKLKLEKSRLSHAIQACEAATASISRPSSPMEMSHQMIPEKELMIRARLEDLAEEVQSWIADLISTINEHERKLKLMTELEQWIVKQNAVINEWSSKPTKFRVEAADQELRQMNDLLRSIAQKKEDSDVQEPILLEKLDKLYSDLEQVINKKRDNQLIIVKYRKSYEEAQNWLDNITRQIDNLEKGSGLNCTQKLEKISNIKKVMDENSDIVAGYKQNASETAEIISNLDSQQIDEQIKSIDRRHTDIHKRISRKLDLIDSTNKSFAKTVSDIAEMHQWLSDCNERINTPYFLGPDAQSAAIQHETFKNVLKEVERKQSQADTIGKRFSGIQSELEPEERQLIEKDIQHLMKSMNSLNVRIRSEIDKIMDEMLCRKNLQNNLEMTRVWIRTKQNDVNKTSNYIPLLASNVLSEIKLCKRHEQAIKEFESNAFKDVIKQINEIMKDCSDEGRLTLTSNFDEIKQKLEELLESCSCKLKIMEHEYQKRHSYEKGKDLFWDWLLEAEKIISTDINVTSLQILNNQLQKLDILCVQCTEMKQSLKELDDYKASIVPTLNDPDKNNIDGQMKIANEKWKVVQNALNSKYEKLMNHKQEYEAAIAKVNNCSEVLAQAQIQIRDMNRPVVSRIENIQDFLMSYETMLGNLKDVRLDLNTILLTNIPQLRENTSKLEEMIIAIEEQLKCSKSMLVLRDQFIAAINEVVKSITKIHTDFNEIEQFAQDIEDRLKRYMDILHQIHLCGGLLSIATDKGHAIANEGTDHDRHNIMDQLHSLQLQLDSIRRSVEIEQDEYKKQHIFYQTTTNGLMELLDWFQQNNDVIKSRPKYSDDTNVSADYLKSHEKISIHARSNINKISELLNKLKAAAKLPTELQEKVFTAQTFINDVPKELIARESYLEANHQYRLIYHEGLNKLKDWLNTAEKRFKSQIDFKLELNDVISDIAEMDKFLESEAFFRKLLFHDIQDHADQFWNTLATVDQDRCLAELQTLKARLSEISNNAAIQQSKLLTNKDLVRQYHAQNDKVKKCLHKMKIDDTIMTLPTLSGRIDYINGMLKANEKDCNELDTLNEISNHIIEQANQFDSSRIRKDNSEINRTWTDCIALLRNLQENLVQLQHQWVQLEDILQELEIKSNSLLEKDKSLDLSIQSKDDILAKKHAIKSLLEDKTTLGELNTKANSLAKTLISALKEQQISPHSLEEKLNHLNQVNTKLQDNLDVKLQKLQNILRELEHYSEEIYTLQKTIGQLFEDLKKIDPFDEKLFQTEKSLNSIKSTAEGYLNHKVQLQNQIKDKYLSSQPFIPNDLADQLNSLETLLTTISFTMEECDRDFKRAKTMRTDYFLAYDRIKTWIENAELTVSNHNIDPSDLKTKLTAFTLECSDLRLLCDQLVLNGNEIIKNCRNYNDRQAMQANMDQICLELIKTIQLIHDKNETVDHILGNWANFMHLYQSVIDWSVTIRLLLEKKLQLNSLPEAQLACQNYTSAVSTLADVSKHLSEMNLEFDKINEVCSTGFLKNKLHEADTVKVNMETTLFERNLFLQETTEEWQQYEHKIKSVNEWIKESYETLSSPEMKIKPLRDQLRILDQMLADISAQKIKVNMSLEKLQVHFHSEIICTDNPSIVYNGRSVLDSLDKLNTDVLQTTQNLNKTLVKIEECQYEMQTLRHHIVQEEQQLRNILSPLHQSSDSDKNEKECRDRIQALQSHVIQKNAEIKLLLQRGAPE